MMIWLKVWIREIIEEALWNHFIKEKKIMDAQKELDEERYLAEVRDLKERMG